MSCCALIPSFKFSITDLLFKTTVTGSAFFFLLIFLFVLAVLSGKLDKWVILFLNCKPKKCKNMKNKRRNRRETRVKVRNTSKSKLKRGNHTGGKLDNMESASGEIREIPRTKSIPREAPNENQIRGNAPKNTLQSSQREIDEDFSLNDSDQFETRENLRNSQVVHEQNKENLKQNIFTTENKRELKRIRSNISLCTDGSGHLNTLSDSSSIYQDDAHSIDIDRFKVNVKYSIALFLLFMNHFISFLLMMFMMTFNMWIVVVIIIGKIVGGNMRFECH